MDFRRLQKRVIGILANPTHEWRAIAVEEDDIASVYKRYILWIAAIPAVCLFIGLGVIGAPFGGRSTVALALNSAIYGYLTALVITMAAALVVEKLAPRFKSQGSIVNALKLVAYASTPMWVAGIFNLFLYIAPLGVLVTVYSVYLFYLGLPAMMKTHPENVVPYTLVSTITVLVLISVVASFRSLLGMPSFGL
jgi:hypothetical protein